MKSSNRTDDVIVFCYFQEESGVELILQLFERFDQWRYGEVVVDGGFRLVGTPLEVENSGGVFNRCWHNVHWCKKSDSLSVSIPVGYHTANVSWRELHDCDRSNAIGACDR
ncbi:MAG: hypothetical protein GXX96_37120 [Planctomycetaceae bacterium]|nr:hypothetical protein [Planctomycetaceae bacterium]